MVSIYTVQSNTTDYKSFYPTETDENAILEMRGALDFHGKPRKDDWISMPVYLRELEDYNIGKQSIPDIVSLRSTLVLSEKAKKVLMPYLSYEDELLPLEHENDTWYVLNVVKKMDMALDREKTTYYVDELMEVTGAKKYVFKSELLNGVHLFKLGVSNFITIYCSEQFKKAIEDNYLTGVKFEEL
ncbi:imm11 family protein [Aliikangiella sp. IMCC44359]|uniref:imm11 family protein n=1 Tax=Aliikangiella sp. IMCC44359 TaxID=3459125 RepID=UPI00403B2BA1